MTSEQIHKLIEIDLVQTYGDNALSSAHGYDANYVRGKALKAQLALSKSERAEVHIPFVLALDDGPKHYTRTFNTEDE